MKVTVNPRPSVPKHLLPTKPTRRLRKQLQSERIKREAGVRAKADREKEKRVKVGDAGVGGVGGVGPMVIGRDKSSVSSNYDYDSVKSLEMRGHFKWLKGRRFHDVMGVRYLLPNDTREMQRLQLQHYVIKWAFQRNYRAPISHILSSSNAKILDVGCGPGAWVVDMAVEFPTAQVFGIDISEVFPTTPTANSPPSSEQDDSLTATAPFSTYRSNPEPELPPKFTSTVLNQLRPLSGNGAKNAPAGGGGGGTGSGSPTESKIPSYFNLVEVYVPPNVVWKVGNILDGLPWPDETFEFVHQRMFSFAYTRQQWMKGVNELIRVTKRGGFVQLVELDVNLKKMGLKSNMMNQKMIHAIRARDVEPDVANSLKEMLTAGGLVDVQSTFVSIPIGEWGLEIGKLWKENFCEVVQSCRPWLTKSLGMRSKEYNAAWQAVIDEFEQQKTYSDIVIVWAQKPLEGDLVTCWDKTKFHSDMNAFDWGPRTGEFSKFRAPAGGISEVEGKFADHILRDMERHRTRGDVRRSSSSDSGINGNSFECLDNGPNFPLNEWRDT